MYLVNEERDCKQQVLMNMSFLEKATAIFTNGWLKCLRSSERNMDPERGKEKSEWNDSYLYNPVILLEPCHVARDLCSSQLLPRELKQPVWPCFFSLLGKMASCISCLQRKCGFICSAVQIWMILVFIKGHSFIGFVIFILKKMTSIGNVCVPIF